MADAGGYAMAVLLVGIAIMMVLLSVAMPVWHQAMQREKEEELIFRGNQYARAIGLFQRKNAGSFPPNVDYLVKQKFLRKKYKDPMTADGVFQLLPAGAGGQPGLAAGTTRQGTQSGSRDLSSVPPRQPGQPPPTTTSGGVSNMGNYIGPFGGVVSKSKEKSIRLYNGKDHYNEWMFTYGAASGRGGAGRGAGRGLPGVMGGPGGGQSGSTQGRGGRGGSGPGQ